MSTFSNNGAIAGLQVRKDGSKRRMHKQNLLQASHLRSSLDTNQTTLRGTAFSPDTQEMLDCLRAVAAAEIERKHRLGHYVVVWQDGRPALIGEDAPLNP